MNAGVIYVATGEKYVLEACKSATRLKEVMPSIPITFFTDKEILSKAFEKVEIIEPFHKRSKIPCLVKSPYEQTLYLDSDTYVTDDLSELFQLLDRFDIALVQSPCGEKYEIKGIPDCFPEFNSGVILYKKTSKVYDLFRTWKTLYERDLLNSEQLVKPQEGCLQDQATFKEAIYYSELRIATLPPEYNCSINNPGRLLGKVKILQGRHPSFPSLARKMNKKLGERVHIRQSETKMMIVHRKRYFPWRLKLERLRDSLKKRGLINTISHIASNKIFPHLFPIRKSPNRK